MKVARLFVLPSGRRAWLEALASLPRDVARPVLWLGDDSLLTSAAEVFPEAEVLSSGAFKNGLFPRTFTSVVPTEIRRHSGYLKAEQNALYSLQRYEDLGRIPYLKRRSYVSTVADHLYSAIVRTRPTHVVASEAPHTIHNLLAVGLCDALDLPLLHFQKSGIGPFSRPRLGMDYKDAGHLMPREVSSYGDHGDSQSVPWMEMLLRRLDQSELPDYEILNLQREHRLNGLKGHVRKYLPTYFRFQLLRSIESRLGIDGVPRLHRVGRASGVRGKFADGARAVYETRRSSMALSECQRFLAKKSVDHIEKDAITFFLHYEPEMTSIPDAQHHGEQLAVVRALSVAVPPNFKIYVREHPSQMMMSTRGYLGRDLYFYEELAALPNVQFLNSKYGYLDTIKNSRMVATLTGTVALEAALLGVPSLVFGHPWYEGLPGCVQVPDLAHVKELIEYTLSSRTRPLDPDELDAFMRHHFIEMVTVPSEQKRWEKFGWSAEREVELIASSIGKFLEQV